MVTTIFMMCFHTGGPKGTQILAMTCKHLYQKIIGPKGFVEQFSLEQLCPRLTILDLDQKNVLKSAKYNKLQILNACDKLLSQEILGNQGLTLIYMPQGGLTLVNLLNQATKEKVVMEVGRGKMKDFEGIGYFDSSQKPPYLVLIMNGLFSESFDNTGLGNYEALCALVKEIGCELPRLEELLALHIFSPKLAQMMGKEVNIFWRCSNTFSQGEEVIWGIEHYWAGDDGWWAHNNIQICTHEKSLWLSSHACQGAIRFFPSKK
jgi:hypothetical protein